MYKKIIIYSFIIISFSSAFNRLYSFYPHGDSAGFFIRAGFPTQVSLGITGKFDVVPFMFGGILNIGISSTGFAFFGVSVSADWWGLKHRLGMLGDSHVWIYFGPGAEGVMEFGNKYWNIEANFRLPVGFSFIVDRDWEIFLQAAPGLSVIAVGNDGFRTFGWYPSSSGWSFSKFFRFYGDFGFRYWF